MNCISSSHYVCNIFVRQWKTIKKSVSFENKLEIEGNKCREKSKFNYNKKNKEFDKRLTFFISVLC